MIVSATLRTFVYCYSFWVTSAYVTLEGVRKQVCLQAQRLGWDWLV